MEPRNVEEWFDFTPHLLLDDSWVEVDIAEHSAKAAIYHCDCHWGGRLVKFVLSGVVVHNPPLIKSHALVRPEVRALHQNASEAVFAPELLELHDPGTTTVQQFSSWGLLRLGSLLFADLEEPFRKNSSDLLRCSSAASYQNLRRDYPDFGDSALSFYQDGVGRAGLLVCHPCEEDGRFDVIGVFNVPHEKFDDWSAIHFNLVLESAQRVADRFLNGPSISTMRESDEYFYIVLTIQSCKRGLPLVPLVTDELPTTTIVAGERLGLDRWIRFNPESVGSSKFYLSEYIKVLLSNVGENIDAYNSMDGRTLMPYQCAVRREQWSSLRTRFVEVFLLQKTAYRRANGGSTAPSMHEGVEPRFSPDTSVMLLRERLFRGKSQTAHQKVLVRRTFLELEEDEYKMGRDQRRHKTTTVLPENSPILAA
eukprot:CAMPEP_0181430676 /NCGR_PEP_ID=MMETSP1110-20121109/17845_1 /TAXON_ID=174948 /ORGANISM="Symbiodinium sp., Strain CCMP421" /LENGTH=422 /DNA_ID=CAMNT_0023553997 /DNA_START=52 /DNA_END=1320 /DNA_ORIENTATION=-